MSSILLCDDEVMLSRVLIVALNNAGHTVRYVRCGHDAIAAATAQRFELALIDLGLPDIPGLAVLQAVRALPDPPEVLVMTGLPSFNSTLAALDLGAHDCLNKPFSLADLRSKVAQVLSRRAAAEQGGS
ncbi:MAG: response regulator [Polyangia bacterium]